MSDTYVPFITDPRHLGELDGTTYVVLRPRGDVVDAYAAVRDELRQRLGNENVSFPAYPHVTLRGWPAGTDLERIRDAVGIWAKRTAPLLVAIDRIGTFPPPYRVVVVIVRKTDALRHAFASLLDVTRHEGLPVWPEWTGDPQAWEFHMSPAYCSALSDDEWNRAASFAATLSVDTSTCDVPDAEIATFVGGTERSGGVFRFEAPR